MSSDTVSIREAFYAVQGEGARMGQATAFLRLAGCNLDCWFCDTDWQHGDKMSVADAVDLVQHVSHPHRPGWVTLTGGEPTVAPAFDNLVEALRIRGYHVSVETNGTRWRDSLLHCQIVVSPKGKWEGAKATLDPGYSAYHARRGESTTPYPLELKVVVEADDTVGSVNAVAEAMQPITVFDYRWVQPRYDSRAAWQRAFEIVKADPHWRLSLQTHKWLGCR